MQIDRSTFKSASPSRAFCALECDGCTGMCLALYMMLTRDEQDAMCRQYRQGAAPVTRH